MEDTVHVPYGGVFIQTNAQDVGNRTVSCMTVVTCFNECKEGWNMHNQYLMVTHGVQDEVRGIGDKIACPFFDSDSSVHIQDGEREKTHHTDFFTFLYYSFSVCVISLIQSSCECPALDAPSSNSS